MVHWLKSRSWSPFLVGALIGVLSWFTFLTADAPLGVSTTFVRAAAWIEQTIAPGHVAATPYFAKNGPKIDWQFTLVIGLVLGAYLSSKLSGDRTSERVPALWNHRFGPSVGLRAVAAFIGGAILLFGARMADG